MRRGRSRGLPGERKSPGSGGALGAVARRGLKTRNRDEPGDTKAAGKRSRRSRRKSFPLPHSLRKPVERSQATTPKLYTQAAVGDGVRHGPGRDRPLAPPLPRTRSQRKNDDAHPHFPSPTGEGGRSRRRRPGGDGKARALRPVATSPSLPTLAPRRPSPRGGERRPRHNFPSQASRPSLVEPSAPLL